MNHQPPRPNGRPDEPAPAGLDPTSYRGTLDGLLDAVDAVDSLPAAERDRLRGAADATRQRHEQLRQTVARLQETLDFLRLSIKYLCFDLEATRRENDYLRRLVDDNGTD